MPYPDTADSVPDDSHEPSAFAELVDVLFPGDGLVALIHAFFDESSGLDGSMFCVAGYIFKKSSIREFDRLWIRDVLNGDGGDIPYFRMSACAHGNEPFDRLSKEERIRRQKRAIELIKDHAEAGYGVVINQKLFDEFTEHASEFPTGAYEASCWLCLMGVRRWMDVKRWPGKAAYFFEAGHRSQTKANNIMQTVFGLIHLREAYRYAAHSFIDKRDAPAIQAADLLAWQWIKDIKNELEGRPRRKDFSYLVDGTIPHELQYLDALTEAARVRDLMRETRADYEAFVASRKRGGESE